MMDASVGLNSDQINALVAGAQFTPEELTPEQRLALVTRWLKLLRSRLKYTNVTLNPRVGSDMSRLYGDGSLGCWFRIVTKSLFPAECMLRLATLYEREDAEPVPTAVRGVLVLLRSGELGMLTFTRKIGSRQFMMDYWELADDEFVHYLGEDPALMIIIRDVLLQHVVESRRLHQVHVDAMNRLAADLQSATACLRQ